MVYGVNEDYFCRPSSPMDHIYEIIRDFRSDDVEVVKLVDVMARCSAKGFHPDLVNQCLDQYEGLGVWYINQAHTTLTFI